MGTKMNILLGLVLFGATTVVAQEQTDANVTRIAGKVRKELVMLPNYGVFDYMSFVMGPGQSGYKITLKGYASRPQLKDQAEKVVRKVEQVETVVNEIEVLPLSPQDEDLRLRAYATIYRHPTLSRYDPNRGAPIYGSSYGARRAMQMGISNNPPPGPHPISIIAKSGNLILEGVVDNEGDKNIVNVLANGVRGAFSVTNNLVVLQPSKKK